MIINLRFSCFAESHPLDNLTVKVTLTHCQIGKLSRDQGARHYNFSKHLIFQNISKNCQTALSQPLCFGFSRPGGESEARAREPTQPLFTSLRSHTTERERLALVYVFFHSSRNRASTKCLVPKRAGVPPRRRQSVVDSRAETYTILYAAVEQFPSKRVTFGGA